MEFTLEAASLCGDEPKFLINEIKWKSSWDLHEGSLNRTPNYHRFRVQLKIFFLPTLQFL